MILQHHNIPTSPFITIYPFERPKTLSEDSLQWTRAIKERLEQEDLELSETSPLFIKPTMEGGSNGIDHRSKVATLAKLVEMSVDLHQRFPYQPLLIEKYADGREFTASIIGTANHAIVLGIFEFRKIQSGDAVDHEAKDATELPAEDDVDFATYKVKSVATANFFELINVTHEASDEVREVGRIALAAFRVLDCRDLGRIDIRSFGRGSDARPQVLEVSPNKQCRKGESHPLTSSCFYR